MAQPTAFRHNGAIHLNRHDGTSIALSMEEAVVIAALVGPSAEAQAAAARHLEMLRVPLGSRHARPRED